MFRAKESYKSKFKTLSDLKKIRGWEGDRRSKIAYNVQGIQRQGVTRNNEEFCRLRRPTAVIQGRYKRDGG